MQRGTIGERKAVGTAANMHRASVRGNLASLLTLRSKQEEDMK